MKSSILWGLVGLNALLLFMFIGNMKSNSAVAQFKRPPDYILIPGAIPGAVSDVIYVIDTTNGYLGAMYYDPGLAGGRLQVMRPIDLNQVYGAARK